MKLAMTLPDQVYRLGALRRALAAAATVIAVAAGQMRARDCLKQARLCAKLTRSLIARSVHNQRLVIKRVMQADPVRRAQVLHDLGGEAALRRWEARLERARLKAIFDRARARYEALGIAPKPVMPPENIAVQSARQSMLLRGVTWRGHEKIERYPNLFHDPCRLDRSGVFRLAAIRRGPRVGAGHNLGVARQEARTGVLRREGKISALSGLQAPIPLIPRDLRMRAGASRQAMHGAGLRSGAGSGSGSGIGSGQGLSCSSLPMRPP